MLMGSQHDEIYSHRRYLYYVYTRNASSTNIFKISMILQRGTTRGRGPIIYIYRNEESMLWMSNMMFYGSMQCRIKGNTDTCDAFYHSWIEFIHDKLRDSELHRDGRTQDYADNGFESAKNSWRVFPRMAKAECIVSSAPANVARK